MTENRQDKVQGRLKNIMIVDDDDQIRNLLYRLLQQNGYHVITRPSGQTALDSLKKERPDLIILDHQMPEMDGLVTLRKIREFDKEIPVIMLTGYATGKLQLSALKLGVNDFLIKGMPSGRFLTSIKDTIERQRILALKKKPAGKGGRIMVVDDEPKIIKLLTSFLSKRNHEVKTASSGEEAIALIKTGTYQPDAAIIDIKLPGLDGLVALKEIRKLNKDISVIIITGSDELSVRQQVMELGALEYLTKPLDLEYLELTIRIRAMGQTHLWAEGSGASEEKGKTIS